MTHQHDWQRDYDAGAYYCTGCKANMTLDDLLARWQAAEQRIKKLEDIATVLVGRLSHETTCRMHYTRQLRDCNCREAIYVKAWASGVRDVQDAEGEAGPVGESA